MRRFWLMLGGLLLAPAYIMAQQQPMSDPKLDEVLGQWERAMTSMNSVVASCTRTTIKKTFKTVEVYKGEARLLKSNFANQSCRASLALFKEGRQDVFDKIICTGSVVFMYDPTNKVLRWAEQPASGKGQLSDNNFLDFLFGMKAGEVTQRYQITYVPSNDKWYHYLKIEPRTEQDKASFKEARVALNVNNFLPRQLWFLQRNDDEVTWDFPRMSPNDPSVRPQDFETPDTPSGWKLEQMQRNK